MINRIVLRVASYDAYGNGDALRPTDKPPLPPLLK